MFCSQVRLREIVKKRCSISRDKKTDKIEIFSRTKKEHKWAKSSCTFYNTYKYYTNIMMKTIHHMIRS